MRSNNNFAGSGAGRGAGRGGFGGRGGARAGGGRLGGQGAGPGGFCVCPSCGAKVEHQPGIPCTEVKCPNCGTPMIRES